ncbi:MAG: DNA replication/repair protein RecF [Coriobacteriia bacterium]|nr:DNA replication/repair protein RecF [Coriobacteriia bacterium]
MLISRLELDGFRNYKHLFIEPSPGLTVLVGPNAAGKTNVVEAIQLLTTGRSFRNPKWADIVRWGSESATLRLTIEADGATTATDMVVTAEGARSYRLNGATRRRHSDITGFIPSVIFTPDNLALPKGPADNRRAAIDDLGEQLSKTYGSIRRDYARTVRQRNAVLKENRYEPEILTALDEHLVALGSSLCSHRWRLLKRVAATTIPLYARLAGGEGLGVRYESSILGDTTLKTTLTQENIQSLFREALASRRRDEKARQTTLVGPHRDDIVFEVEGRDARTFASQGQQRTIALAWKWAEVGVIEEIAHRTPVLLLDDVMSELDSTRRAALTGLMQSGAQAVVTTTNAAYFDPELLMDACVIEIPGS